MDLDIAALNYFLEGGNKSLVLRDMLIPTGPFQETFAYKDENICQL